MSFADKAYKEVLKQLKKEGKEFIFCEECNTEEYKSIAADYGMLEQEDSSFPEEILEQKSVPDIINAFKKYYIKNYYNLENTFNLLADEEDHIYGFGDDLEETDVFDDEKEEEEDEYDPFLLYGECANIDSSYLSERKTKEEIIERFDKALQDYLKAPEKTVSDFVIQKQNELNLKAPEVYKPVFMTKQNYSKIISNYTKHPKFEACIQLAFGLKLNLEDTTELLRRAGNAFSDDIYDRLIMYFIEHQRYNMDELNECLYKLREKPIGSF